MPHPRRPGRAARDRHVAQLGGGELDAERQPVHRSADAQDPIQDRVAQLQLGSRRRRGKEERACGWQAGRGVTLGGLVAQRLEPDELLAGDVERHPAGGERPDASGGGQEVGDQCRRRLDHVLAVVQDQEPPVAGSSPDRRGSRRLAWLAAGLQGQGHQLDQVGVAGCRAQVAPHHGLGPRPVLGPAVAQLHGEAGLADAAAPDDRDQPGALQGGLRPGQHVVTADEGRQRGGRARGGGRSSVGRGRGDADREALAEDVRLQGAQLRGGFEAKVLGDPGPQPLVGGEGIGLAAQLVERLHQHGVGPLPVGVCQREPLDVVHQVGGGAGGEEAFEARLGDRQAQLVQPGRLTPPRGRCRRCRPASRRARGRGPG